MEYYRTKDILYRQQVLGHENIQKTLRYIALADAGFEYVTGEYDDGGKIFRRPKHQV